MCKGTIAIIGGGIGGIAAGIALRNAGFAVKVFERAGQLREAGSGVSLWPNGTGILDELGVLPTILSQGQRGTHFLLRSDSGALLMNIKTAEADTPTVCVHRADLLHALADVFPPECVYLDHELTAAQVMGQKVRVQFSNQSSFVCDGVVGADGIHSRVRRMLVSADRPSYRGYAVFRGLVDLHPSIPAGHNGESWGSGQRFGFLAIGKNKVCWYATANTPDPQKLADQGKGVLEHIFRSWHHPIPEMLAATDPATILVNSACDVGPFRSRGIGPVTLLGDAAHALTPNLGQGAGMALEDAFVLARCLRSHSTIAEGFRSYESLRFPHARSAVLRSRWLGQVGQWEGRTSVSLRNAITRLLPAQLFECHSTFTERIAALTGGMLESA
jgi:2-polyprenyl-6-methoxyphenol hydroxylase-like FAD-dependent oxidoreductase